MKESAMPAKRSGLGFWGAAAALGVGMGASVLLASTASAQVTNEDFKLLADDGAGGDQYGVSVSISGDVAVIGAAGHGDNGSNSGSAYVYRFDGTDWVQEAKLLASDGATDGFLGRSVSISGDVAVIGAYAYLGNGSNFGAAYVYRFDGTGWAEEAKLLHSDGVEYDRFGKSVSISGDVAVIGAYDDSESDPGSAYVYRFDGHWLGRRSKAAGKRRGGA